jgi:hypothetical protein
VDVSDASAVGEPIQNSPNCAGTVRARRNRLESGNDRSHAVEPPAGVLLCGKFVNGADADFALNCFYVESAIPDVLPQFDGAVTGRRLEQKSLRWPPCAVFEDRFCGRSPKEYVSILPTFSLLHENPVLGQIDVLEAKADQLAHSDARAIQNLYNGTFEWILRSRDQPIDFSDDQHAGKPARKLPVRQHQRRIVNRQAQ